MKKQEELTWMDREGSSEVRESVLAQQDCLTDLLTLQLDQAATKRIGSFV